MTGPRARRRQELDRRILDAGRAQLAEVGAAALSVRAIARELGMVSSAVYRYVESRDELLTRLVVASYDDLADHVESAVTAAPGSAADRVRTALRAFRAWAVGHPAEYALLYGSPVPGYAAPAERTTGPGTRVIGLLLRLCAEAGASPAAPAPPPGAPLNAELEAIAAEFDVELTSAELVTATTLWTWLLGAVGQEVTGGYGPETFSDPSALFEAQLRWQLSVAGM
ncbi:MAG: TetR/AcrR family transcriptional regulator [Gordonia sp. (in: high G+C Gram-positive bacteria)]|uniref:TetR/AcrR family transcriptional regulator n=1 Tax=Gordonia sp. (in: high G+C Gram-positive bacteria) TaxID=84139 RepID=UPI0039E63296